MSKNIKLLLFRHVVLFMHIRSDLSCSKALSFFMAQIKCLILNQLKCGDIQKAISKIIAKVKQNGFTSKQQTVLRTEIYFSLSRLSRVKISTYQKEENTQLFSMSYKTKAEYHKALYC